MPPRRMLVYVNPVSGRGNGPTLFMSRCAGMLADAGISVRLVCTERAGQSAAEIADMPADEIARLEGIIAVGGDGALAEVLAGVMARHDWRTVAARTRLGVLPAGSGNGFAVSLLSAARLPYSLDNACLLLAKGADGRVDIASTFVQGGSAVKAGGGTAAAAVSVGAAKDVAEGAADRVGGGDRVVSMAGDWGTRHYQFLSTSWAIISDIDLESESLRCLGAARFDVYGALRAFCLRKYRGRFSYLPADVSERAGAGWSAAGGAGKGDVEAGGSESGASGLDGGGHSDDSVGGGAPPAIRSLVPFGRPTPLSWRTVEGTFTLLYVTNSSHQSIGVCAAPGSRHDDGVLTVTYAGDAGACSMVPLLLGLDDAGTFATASNVNRGGIVHTHTALAFRLEPETDAARSRQGA